MVGFTGLKLSIRSFPAHTSNPGAVHDDDVMNICSHHHSAPLQLAPAAARNLQANQPAPPAATSAQFSLNPQDSTVMGSAPYTIDGLIPGDTPAVAKAKLDAPLAPNADGTYVYPENDPRYTAANTFASVAKTIKFFEEGTGHSISWSFKRDQIDIHPDKDEMLNAYYQPGDGSLNFFHATDPVTKQVVFSGHSGEVVSHETGHAILDSIRPAYIYNWRPDAGGFHESFGDMMGLLRACQDDRTLAKIVEQTGGDMTKPNVAAELGEELGTTINNTVGANVTGGNYTRNAINKLVWADPKTLPKNPKDPNELGSEVHNYSRVFTAGFYDIFTGLVNENRAAGMEPAQAIREASNEGLRILGRAVENAPKLDPTFASIAKAFVTSDQKLNEGKHADLITKCFKDRKILPSTFSAADAANEASFRGEEIGDPKAFNMTTVDLGDGMGKFSGCKVQVAADPFAPRFAADDSDVQDDMAHHIKNGDILYTEPNQVVSQKDLFKADGHPYVGVVRWDSGQPVIERNLIVT